MKKILFLLLLFASSRMTFAQTNPNFFPIGVWLQSPVSNAANYKNAGVNMFVGLWNPLDQPQLSALRNAGMKVICEQNAFGLSNVSDTVIYGWHIADDEPDNAQWNASTNQYDPCIAPSVILNKYNTIKANDGTRPIYLNLGQGVSYINWIGRGTCTGKWDMYPVYNNGYLKACDIGSFDIYPVNNSDTTTSGKLWYVPKGVDSLRSWSGNAKPMWCWIECTKIDANSAGKPTTANVKTEVWMALVHGAKGFGYFCHSWTPSFAEAALLNDNAMTAAVTAINTQVTSLAPVLNSANTTGYATVSSSNPATPVHFMTKNYGGANYIFAVAMRNYSTTATFTVTSGNTVTVLGESRTINISGGKFTDNFAGYGVHLYKITSATGMAETQEVNRVNVYPNPFSQTLFVEMDPSSGDFEFILYDLSGRVVYRHKNTSTGKLTIPKGELQNGMYFYSAGNDRVFSKGKVVIAD